MKSKGLCIYHVREWPTKRRVGPAALRRAGPPVSQPTSTEWWACARSELVPPYHATDRSLSNVNDAQTLSAVRERNDTPLLAS